MKAEKAWRVAFMIAFVCVSWAGAQDLFESIQKGDLESIEQLIANDPELVNLRRGSLYPLHLAVRSGKKEIAEFLISKGADIDRFAKNASEFAPFEFSAMTEAVRFNNLDMVKMFVERGADLDKVTSLEESYLHYAAFMNRTEIAEHLIESGMDVNIKKRGDITPLHLAAVRGFSSMAGMLIKRGAVLDIKSTDGGTPLHFAEAAGNAETAEFLRSKGAKSGPRDFPEYSGAYLGIEKPGSEPEPFAPELFRDIYRVHSAPAFSPDGKEVYWECIFIQGDNDASRIWYMKEENGRWTPPRIAPFSEYISGGPAFFRDGRRLLYFSMRPRDGGGEPAKDLDLWVVERKGGGWGEPQHLASPLNRDGTQEVYPLVAGDGSIYLGINRVGHVKSDFANGKYAEVETIGDLFDTDYVDDNRAMDHILLFSDKGRDERFEYEVYVSFHLQEGRWSKPVYLGDRLHPGRRATQAAVSIDGKYLFFVSYFHYYWVDAGIIEDLRPED